VLGILRRYRRKRLLTTAIDPAWLDILRERVPFFAELDDELRDQFLRDLRVFIAEKYWIEAGGMHITDEVKVVIAAAAVRLTLRLGIDVYDRLTEIVVYPSHYHHPDEDESVVFGEAHQWGTVVLSWDAVLAGLANPRDGHDTATHEFAHVLDRADGDFNGAPELRAREHYRAWAAVMSKHYERLRKRRPGIRNILRAYGATNEAEFFAVATESFFEKPETMKSQLPDLYAELRQFYGFDPGGDSSP